MVDSIQSQSETYWHDKYFNLLSELESQTKANADTHEVLRSGLVMTSLLAEGQTIALDRQLKALRDSLKPGNDELSETLSSLRKTIDEFDDESVIHIEVLLGLITDTAHKLSLCPLPQALLKKIKETRHGASHQLEHWIGYREQLQSWLEIIGSIIETDHDETLKSSWWKKLFQADEVKSAEKQPASTSEINTEVKRLINGVSKTVDKLLEKLIIPEHLSSAQLNIQERLKQPLQWHEFAPVLDDTANFLFSCIEASQSKIETFLQSLDVRLQDLRGLVVEADTGTDKRTAAREEMDISIRQQLSEIHTMVSNDSNLSHLGTQVPKHLELIIRALEENRDQEDLREKHFKAHIKKLQSRLNSMEKELENSQKTLDERKRNANLDPLTHLPKREAFQLRINEEVAKSKQLGTPLSLAFCDIDSFKRINDTYGYLSGNRTLELIARVFRKHIRDTDFIVRFGGEKFLILLPNTDAEQALKIAENLRQLIENSPFSFRKERVFITVSIGIAQLQHNETHNNAFERAKKAVETAKTDGSNQCVLAAL